MFAHRMNNNNVLALLELYPKIYFACHTRHAHDPATGQQVSAAQASILDHLDAVEAIGLVDLARHMGVTPGTMSIAVDRLVRRGYAERTRDTGDARRVRLRITQAGLRVREAKSVLDPDLVAALFAALSPQDAADGIRGLRLLADAAQAIMTAKSESGQWSRRRKRTEPASEPGTAAAAPAPRRKRGTR